MTMDNLGLPMTASLLLWLGQRHRKGTSRIGYRSSRVRDVLDHIPCARRTITSA